MEALPSYPLNKWNLQNQYEELWKSPKFVKQCYCQFHFHNEPSHSKASAFKHLKGKHTKIIKRTPCCMSTEPELPSWSRLHTRASGQARGGDFKDEITNIWCYLNGEDQQMSTCCANPVWGTVLCTRGNSCHLLCYYFSHFFFLKKEPLLDNVKNCKVTESTARREEGNEITQSCRLI